jgi:hypothetical protein
MTERKSKILKWSFIDPCAHCLHISLLHGEHRVSSKLNEYGMHYLSGEEIVEVIGVLSLTN